MDKSIKKLSKIIATSKILKKKMDKFENENKDKVKKVARLSVWLMNNGGRTTLTEIGKSMGEKQDKEVMKILWEMLPMHVDTAINMIEYSPEIYESVSSLVDQWYETYDNKASIESLEKLYIKSVATAEILTLLGFEKIFVEYVRYAALRDEDITIAISYIFNTIYSGHKTMKKIYDKMAKLEINSKINKLKAGKKSELSAMDTIQINSGNIKIPIIYDKN